MRDYIKDPHFHKLIKILLIVIIVLVIFSAGMAVGFFKGEFSERWDEHYMGMMSGPRSPFSAFSDSGSRAPSPHGTAGQVVSATSDQVVVQGPGDTESLVVISPQTIIRSFHQQGTTTDIKAGSWITAIGSPDENGRLVATFIRIMPAPQQMMTTTTTTVTYFISTSSASTTK